MNPQQPQGKPVNPNLLIQSYKNELTNLTHDLVLAKAYIVQLEQELEDIKSSSAAQEK